MNLTLGNVDMARAAKEGLDGADIYSGCCTLKIEYAKVSRYIWIELNIHKSIKITICCSQTATITEDN